MRWPPRYAPTPWSDPAPSDLQPQGIPEFMLEWRRETHFGLDVHGAYVRHMGMLAIRCEQAGGRLVPVSLAIADTAPLMTSDGVQSNPRRLEDPDPGDCQT